VTRKRIVPRERAKRDAEEAVDYYLSAGGEKAALGFVDALERAYRHIARHPAAASLRYAHELDVPGLRCWPLKRYPYLVFFVERDDHVDVWRVLHAERDIPAWMREPQSD
jgi:toxin ParE1/3/4